MSDILGMVIKYRILGKEKRAIKSINLLLQLKDGIHWNEKKFKFDESFQLDI